MKKELLEYFNNAHKLKCCQYGDTFIEDGIGIRQIKPSKVGVDRVNFFNYLMGDDLMVVKTTFDHHWRDENIMEVISGDYFNTIGVTSVEAYPIKIKQIHPITKNLELFPAVATFNLMCLKDYDVELAINVMCDNRDVFNDYKLRSDMPISKECKEAFLEFMTEDCYNDWINLFLADRLGTYRDRHLRNYFFYRKKSGAKWEGVIAIDNEQSKIVNVLGDKKKMEKASNSLIYGDYFATNPFQQTILVKHANYINYINNLVDKGDLGDSQIELIKKALEYPYAENLKSKCNGYGFKCDNIYELSARLWEYNRENLNVK